MKKVYFYELKSFFLPLIDFSGKILEALGLTDYGNSFFWLQRHLFEIVERRFKKNVNIMIY